MISTARQRKRSFLAYAGIVLAVALSTALLPAVANAAFGGLTQPSGPEGCVSLGGLDPFASSCMTAWALERPVAADVSPDGKNLYVTSSDEFDEESGRWLGHDALLVFKRDSATGAVEQLSGDAGCINARGSDRQGNPCRRATYFHNPREVKVSNDGRYVYVAAFGATEPYSPSPGAVLTFKREPDGSLKQLEDSEQNSRGCIRDEGVLPVCQKGYGIKNPYAIAIPRDNSGDDVYVASAGSSAVAHLKRRSDGELVQETNDPQEWCISQGGASGDPNCTRGRALSGAMDVEVSFDGRHVYAASPKDIDAQGSSYGAVAVLVRSNAGGLVQAAADDRSGCISSDGSGGSGAEEGVCNPGRFKGITSLALSDQNVYATSSETDALVTLLRNAGSGALTQPSGASGCISSSGSDGGDGVCAKGSGLGRAFQASASRDGKNIYVASPGSEGNVVDAVAVLSRAGNGAVAQVSGAGGCISQNGVGGCAKGRALEHAVGTVVSPSDCNVYVVAHYLGAPAANRGAVANLSRECVEQPPRPPTPPALARPATTSPATPAAQASSRQAAKGTRSCDTVKYENRLTVQREVMLRDLILRKGLKAKVSAKYDSKGAVKVELTGRDARVLKIYRGKSKSKRKLLTSQSVVLEAGKAKVVTLRVTNKGLVRKIKRAIRLHVLRKTTRLKVTLLSVATDKNAVGKSGKPLSRLNTQLVRAKRQGNVTSLRTYTKIRTVEGQNPCVRSLTATIKGPRSVKVSSLVTKSGKQGKGVKVRVSCDLDCKATVGAYVFGNNGLALKLWSKGGKTRQKALYKTDVILKAGEVKTVQLKGISSKKARKLFLAADRSKRLKRIRTRFQIDATAVAEGQRAQAAGTARVRFSGRADKPFD